MSRKYFEEYIRKSNDNKNVVISILGAILFVMVVKADTVTSICLLISCFCANYSLLDALDGIAFTRMMKKIRREREENALLERTFGKAS